MSFWTAVVIIVGIIAVAEVLKAKHRARHGITVDHNGTEKLVERHEAELKRELQVGRPRREIEGGAGEGAARIELADLKERIRKLEAIASGVDL